MVGERQHNWYIIGVIGIEQVGEVENGSRVNPIQVPTQGGGYFQWSLYIFSGHFVYILWNSMFLIALKIFVWVWGGDTPVCVQNKCLQCLNFKIYNKYSLFILI